jgi:hydrogenase maturation protease
MTGLRGQLEQCLTGRVCFIGVGNVDYGDDGFGVRLAERLLEAGVPDVIVAGPTPDRWLGQLADFDHVVFLDAVDFADASGSVVLLDRSEMSAVFPQISTHKISLGLLAGWVEANGKTKAWLIGVQPESLKAGPKLTPTLLATLEVLVELLCALNATKGHVGTDALVRPAERKLGAPAGGIA